MLDQATAGQLASHLDNAQTVVVVVTSQANRDTLAAASALSQSLLKHQKVVRFVAAQPKKLQEQQHITGLEALQGELGNQNLSISFPYAPEQVDKVSYHIGEETNRFYLTIKPKSGSEPINYSDVEFAYTGTTADLFILVGVNALEDLEQLYFGYEDTYKDTPIIAVHTHGVSYATLSIDAGSLSSMSEAVAEVIQTLELPLDSDIATNVLTGIETATRNFSSYAATADTFATVSTLMRAGARRVRVDDTQAEEKQPTQKSTAKVTQLPTEIPLVAAKPQEKKLSGKQTKKNASLPPEFKPGETSRA